MSEERWLPVVGYEGLYEVSDLGNVRVVFSSKHSHIGKTIGSTKNTGYREVVLTGPDGVKSSHRVHKLVLLAFVGPAPVGLECNHKNGVKTDNRLENLEWVTRSEQHLHRVHVLGSDALSCTNQSGEKNRSAKLTQSEVDDIRSMAATGRLYHREIAKMFGVNRQAIGKIVNHDRWRK